MQAMIDARVNERYLPEGPFPELLSAVLDLEIALDGVDEILVSVPSHGLRSTLQLISSTATQPLKVAWATKGLELATGELPHQVVNDVLGTEGDYAVLSGPTFAKELARGLPTADRKSVV